MINEAQNELVLDGFVYQARRSLFGCRDCGFLTRGIYSDICNLRPIQTTYCQANQRNDKRYIIWFNVGKVQ